MQCDNSGLGLWLSVKMALLVGFVQAQHHGEHLVDMADTVAQRQRVSTACLCRCNKLQIWEDRSSAVSVVLDFSNSC